MLARRLSLSLVLSLLSLCLFGCLGGRLLCNSAFRPVALIVKMGGLDLRPLHGGRFRLAALRHVGGLHRLGGLRRVRCRIEYALLLRFLERAHNVRRGLLDLFKRQPVRSAVPDRIKRTVIIAAPEQTVVVKAIGLRRRVARFSRAIDCVVVFVLRHDVEHPADDLRAAAHDCAAQRAAHAGLVDLQSKVRPCPARRLCLAQALIDISLPRLTECGHIHVVQCVRRPFGQIVADLAAGFLGVFARHVGKHGADAASAAVRDHVGQAIKAHLLRRVFQESRHCAQSQCALVAAALHLHVARRVHQRTAADQRRAHSRRAECAADHTGKRRVNNAAHDRIVHKPGRVAAAQLLQAKIAPDAAQIVPHALVARKVLVQPLADVFADCIARRAACIAQVVGIHLIAVNAGLLCRRAPERVRAATDRVVNVGQRADRRHGDRILFRQLGHALGHRVMRALLQIGLEYGDVVLRCVLALRVAQIGQDPAFSARHVVNELCLVRLKARAVGRRLDHLILLRIAILQIPLEVRPVGKPFVLFRQFLPLFVLGCVHVGLERGLLRPYVVRRDEIAALVEERALHAVVFGHIVVVCLFCIQIFGIIDARHGAAHLFRRAQRTLRCAGQPLVRFLLQSVPIGLRAACQQIVEIHRARALRRRADSRLSGRVIGFGDRLFRILRKVLPLIAPVAGRGALRVTDGRNGRFSRHAQAIGQAPRLPVDVFGRLGKTGLRALRVVRRHYKRTNCAACGLPLVFRHAFRVLRRAPLWVQPARKRFRRARNGGNAP